jgi:uncharacterized protein (TIGR03086 family)
VTGQEQTETQKRYARISSGFESRLGGIRPEQWAAPTPCTEWSVRDLVVHVVATHRRVVCSIDGSEPAEVDAAGDLLGQWREATTEVSAALAEPERAATIVGGMFGEQPFESLVGRLLCSDTLVHTWDLARATGQDETLDPEAVIRSSEFLAPIDEAIRRPGGFAAKITSEPGADEQARFLNFCGRAV